MLSRKSSGNDIPLEYFSVSKIEVNVEPMLRIQGYTDLSRVRVVVKKTAKKMATLAENCFRPEVCYLRIPIKSCVNGVLTLDTLSEFHCDAFSKFLTGCHEVVVFVLTVGEQFDRELDKLQHEDKLLEALFFENAGWLGVESATREFAQYLRKQAALQQQKISRRLSPGYSFKLESNISEWSLYEQSGLFDLFHRKHIPVHILESGAMLPKMSRSGIYGIRQLASR